MLDSINVGITGLLGYSDGLRVIANNTANINTPGFKGSTLQFSDLVYGQNAGGAQLGHGLQAGTTTLNFTQGALRHSDNALDLALDGEGLFTLRDAHGKLHYTRAGQFEFDSSGVLVNRGDKSAVMGVDATGNLVGISLNGLRSHKAGATSSVTFTGNLSAQTAQTVGGVTVIDGAGGTHQLSLKFTPGTTAGAWTVDIVDGATQVGTGGLGFINGLPDPAHSSIDWSYTPAGMGAMALHFDFGTNVTSFAAGNQTSLAMDTQDGYAAGDLTKATFDTDGTLVLSYSNGQTVRDARLALTRFDTVEGIRAAGGNQFDAADGARWHVGTAGTGGFGSVHADMVEASNVDLSQEFSNLVIVQRGYQAASQIISSANDMLQQLFSMRGK
jgi:flagellar hook protein FlgE